MNDIVAFSCMFSSLTSPVTVGTMGHTLNSIVNEIEKKTGYLFDDNEVYDVYAYTVRKCELNRKCDDYIPILFENELRDYVMRACINLMGEGNRKSRLAVQQAKI